MLCWGSDQEEHLYFGYSFPQSSTQVVSDSSEQDTKQRDSHQRVENAEQLPSFCFGGDVSKTWMMRGQRRRRHNMTQKLRFKSRILHQNLLMVLVDTHRLLWWSSLRKKRHWPDPIGWRRWGCCWDPHLHRRPPPLPGMGRWRRTGVKWLSLRNSSIIDDKDQSINSVVLSDSMIWWARDSSYCPIKYLFITWQISCRALSVPQ